MKCNQRIIGHTPILTKFIIDNFQFGLQVIIIWKLYQCCHRINFETFLIGISYYSIHLWYMKTSIIVSFFLILHIYFFLTIMCFIKQTWRSSGVAKWQDAGLTHSLNVLPTILIQTKISSTWIFVLQRE